jgi:DNA-binding NtrC family response regulator
MSEVKTITEKDAVNDMFKAASEFVAKPIPFKAIQLTARVVIEQKNKQVCCEPGDYLLLRENNSIQKLSSEDFIEKYKPLGL